MSLTGKLYRHIVYELCNYVIISDINLLNFKVWWFKRHENYVGGSNHDIALIRMNEKVVFDNEIQHAWIPVCQSIYINRAITLVGWGSDLRGGMKKLLLFRVICLSEENTNLYY